MTVQPAPLLQIRSNYPKWRRKRYGNPASPVKPAHQTRMASPLYNWGRRAVAEKCVCPAVTSQEIRKTVKSEAGGCTYHFLQSDQSYCTCFQGKICKSLLLACSQLPCAHQLFQLTLKCVTWEKDGCMYFKFQPCLISKPFCTSSKSYKKWIKNLKYNTFISMHSHLAKTVSLIFLFILI